MPKSFFRVLLGLLLLTAACSPTIPDELHSFYETMQDNALAFPRSGGAWEQHNGDAPYYGLAFYLQADADGERPDSEPPYRDIATAAHTHNIETLRHANADSGYFLQNLEEVMMSTLGLMEYIGATGDRGGMPEVEQTIENIDTLTIGLRNYIDIDAGMFAIRTYGPTAISGAVALLNLQYTTQLGAAADPDLGAQRLGLARDIVAAIDEKAWDGTRYLIRPGDPLLELYPNTMMMLVLGRLYAATGESAYLERAQAAFAAIQPLRRPISMGGGYNSPYSAAEMGAKTDDYSTLSSQNYLTLALAVMYEVTGDRRYFDEALFVLTFIRTHLYDPATGRILHHFIDGRIALPTDPEYFCSGCNLQFLYVAWYLQHAHP